jgi:hypothetical protein
MSFSHDDLGTLDLYTLSIWRFRWLVFAWRWYVHVDFHYITPAILAEAYAKDDPWSLLGNKED